MDFFTREDSIEQLQVSNRLRHCIHKLGIDTIGKLLDFPENSWQNVRNMGAKTVAEVLALTSALRETLDEDQDKKPYLSAELDALQNDLRSEYGISACSSILHQISCEHPNCSGETLIYLVYENETIRNAFLHKVVSILEEKDQGLTIDSLHNRLPDHLSNTTILEELLLSLESSGQIQEVDGIYTRRYPSAIDYIHGVKDEKRRTLLVNRLSGMTLDEAGLSYGLTRERTRQICSKFFEGCPRFAEDRYREIFEKYDFNMESFLYIFHESIEVYHYLESVCNVRGRKRQPLSEILSDSSVSVSCRRFAEAYVYRHYLTIDGIRISKIRADLFQYVVKTTCKDKKPFPEVLSLYSQFLEDHGLADDEKLHVETRTYENKLAKCDYVLWNQNHSLRYYNIANRNYAPLIAEINLAQYCDQEFSTLKVFREHPELMAEFDIRDEFELHNLLKKIWPQWGDCEVTFSKMPTLRLGNYNVDDQVLDLLLQCAPVSALDFAQAYENRYGVKSATALSNYFHCIDPYLINGIYTIDQECLPMEQHDRMKEVLTEDFYTLSDIQRLYQREFPNETRKLNSYNIKTLGFSINSTYVISNRFSNAAAYIRHILTTDDIVDTNNFPASLVTLQSYWSELISIRNQREIVEFAPKHYINIRRLEQNGITKEMLDDYCQQVSRFVDRNTYFTVTSIRQDGFTHHLDDLYFDEWFYSSLLAEDHERFNYRRMGRNRLFYSGSKDVQLSAFLQWIVEKEERIDLDDLTQLLADRYGIVLRRDKILLVLKDTELYYDQIMDRVYIDYDTYFEEV